MGNYNKLSLPLDGDKIEKDSEQKLTVPNQPIIPVIEGDGIGRDIMKATRRVIDAAVQKAFDGEKQIVLIARALKLNPYNQPAVELIKKDTKKILQDF